jgi:hypothetical protein
MASGDRAQLPPPPPPPPPRPPPPTEDHTAVSVPLLQRSPADGEARLARWLRRLEAFLAAAGLAASTRLGVAAAASALAVLGVALPALAVAVSPCRARGSGCGESEVEAFELCVLLSQASAAAVSLACVSRKMAMYGIRKFLFVDPELGMRIRFQKEYVSRIKVMPPIPASSHQLLLQMVAFSSTSRICVCADVSICQRWSTCQAYPYPT